MIYTPRARAHHNSQRRSQWDRAVMAAMFARQVGSRSSQLVEQVSFGASIVMEGPKNGWLIVENPIYTWMITRGSPIYFRKPPCVIRVNGNWALPCYEFNAQPDWDSLWACSAWSESLCFQIIDCSPGGHALGSGFFWNISVKHKHH